MLIDNHLEKLGEIFVVKKSNNIIGSVYPKNGGYEYIDKKGNIFILEENRKNGFTFKKVGESDKLLSNISIFPLVGIDYDMKSHLDTNYCSAARIPSSSSGCGL